MLGKLGISSCQGHWESGLVASWRSQACEVLGAAWIDNTMLGFVYLLVTAGVAAQLQLTLLLAIGSSPAALPL